jgi:hypothetical protein
MSPLKVPAFSKIIPETVFAVPEDEEPEAKHPAPKKAKGKKKPAKKGRAQLY